MTVVPADHPLAPLLSCSFPPESSFANATTCVAVCPFGTENGFGVQSFLCTTSVIALPRNVTCRYKNGFDSVPTTVPQFISGCPLYCECLGSSVFCRSLLLTNITGDFAPSDATMVLFDESVFTELPSEILGTGPLDKLYRLEFTNGYLTYIAPDAFRWLTGLQYLRLDNNYLTAISTATLSFLPRLMHLSVQANKLREVPFFPITPAVPLKELILHNNRFDNFTHASIAGIVSTLQVLSLRNSVEDGETRRLILGDRPFVNCSALVSIDLSGCALNALSADIFTPVVTTLANVTLDVRSLRLFILVLTPFFLYSSTS